MSGAFFGDFGGPRCGSVEWFVLSAFGGPRGGRVIRVEADVRDCSCTAQISGPIFVISVVPLKLWGLISRI